MADVRLKKSMADTIALFSSARRNGNTGRLMDRVATSLNVTVVDLGAKKISPYDYEHRNRQDDFEPLMEEVLRHKQIIFASPVYWYACSPGMKIFLDRISDYLDVPELLEKGRQLRGKTGYVVCTSIQDEVSTLFIDAFRETFSYLGMRFGGYLHANCETGYEEQKYEKDIQAFLSLLGRAEEEA